MSRYIDADYVNAFPIRIDHYDEEHGNRHFVLGIESVMEYIEEAPSIDIVRCAECKYEPICSHSVQHTTHEPTSVTIGYKSVDFCSYGERKESE